MLTDRRDELARQRVQTVNRLQRLLSELIPGQRKKDLSALQAKAMLATVRPRDIAGKTRRRMAAEELADLVAVDAKLKKIKAELKAAVAARGSTLMDIHGIGPAGAARILADVGDVARFADRNRFASWTGTAPLDASSGEQIRHRLSRAGNRRMNHVLHIAAIVQLRHDTEGRAYYRRKLAAGKTPMEALRCLKRRLSDVIYRRLVADAQRTTDSQMKRAREGTAGRLFNPARSTCPRTSTLRISHFPDPRNRRYDRPPDAGRPQNQDALNRLLDTEGSQIRSCLTTRVRSGSRRCRAPVATGSGPAGPPTTSASTPPAPNDSTTPSWATSTCPTSHSPCPTRARTFSSTSPNLTARPTTRSTSSPVTPPPTNKTVRAQHPAQAEKNSPTAPAEVRNKGRQSNCHPKSIPDLGTSERAVRGATARASRWANQGCPQPAFVRAAPRVVAKARVTSPTAVKNYLTIGDSSWFL